MYVCVYVCVCITSFVKPQLIKPTSRVQEHLPFFSAKLMVKLGCGRESLDGVFIHSLNKHFLGIY